MSLPQLIGLIVGGVVTVLGLIGLAVALLPSSVTERTFETYLAEEAAEAQEAAEGGAPSVLSKLRQAIGAMSRSSSKQPQLGREEKTAQALILANLPLTPQEWQLLRWGSALFIGLLMAWRFGLLIGVAGFALVGLVLAGRFLSWRQSRREKKFERQLVDAIDIIEGGVKAGFSLVQALDMVGQRAPQPAASEFSRAAQEIKLGLGIDEALGHLAVRNKSRELTLLCNALRIWRQTGGNITTILESVQNTLRQRIAMKGEISTLTAQARMSAWIIGLLPVALLGILSAITPTYLSPMFSNPLGLGLLIAGGTFIAVGALIMSRMTRVDF